MKKIESLDAIIVLLKAMAEANRLRVLRLLYHEDLTVSDFIFILGQSQLRISRHLRLLYEAQLVESYQKGEQFILSFVMVVWLKKYCNSCSFIFARA